MFARQFSLSARLPGPTSQWAATRKVTPEKQRAACSDVSQPYWLRGARALQSQPFWGLGSCQQRAYLARRACLGSCPCLHGEPELMVLKWRPDGDRGLIAAEAAPSSPPVPAVRLLMRQPRPSTTSIIQHSFSLSSNLPSILPLPLSARPSPPRPAFPPSLPLSRIISAIVSFPPFYSLNPSPLPPPPIPPPSVRPPRPLCYCRLNRTTSSALTCSGVRTLPAWRIRAPRVNLLPPPPPPPIYPMHE